jgi:nucleoside-diphosphate-sugar epimerase
VLVTGAAGFLGRHFVAHYVAAGSEVVGIDDLSGSGAKWLGSGTELTMDVLDLFATNEQFDLAYHFAAPVGGREKIEGDPLYNAHSLGLDEAFFRWAINHVGTAVYPSSSAVYGVRFQRGEGMALPEKLFDPAQDAWGRPDEMYGFTKMAGEVLASKAARYGLNTLCIRPFSGYGEGQSFDYPVPAICARAMMHQDPLVVWGSGWQQRDFIHVSDIVGATAAVLERGVTGYEAINLGSGKPVSFVEVARIAADLAGYGPFIDTDEAKPEGVHARFCDPSRMLAVYQPKVALHQGLHRVMQSLVPVEA